MQLNLLLYGIAKDIIGTRTMVYELTEGASVEDLLSQIQQEYPQLKGLASLKIAVNSEYVEHNYLLQPTDEVVVIPPVSGG